MVDFLRPPTPEEVVTREEEDEFIAFHHSGLTMVFDRRLRDCMQEALTCEWLIEHRLMPDPTEFGIRFYTWQWKAAEGARLGYAVPGTLSQNSFKTLGNWCWEDKTQ